MKTTDFDTEVPLGTYGALCGPDEAFSDIVLRFITC